MTLVMSRKLIRLSVFLMGPTDTDLWLPSATQLGDQHLLICTKSHHLHFENESGVNTVMLKAHKHTSFQLTHAMLQMESCQLLEILMTLHPACFMCALLNCKARESINNLEFVIVIHAPPSSEIDVTWVRCPLQLNGPLRSVCVCA